MMTMVVMMMMILFIDFCSKLNKEEPGK